MMNNTANIPSGKVTAYILADSIQLPRQNAVLRLSQRWQLLRQLGCCSRPDSNSYIRVVVLYALL